MDTQKPDTNDPLEAASQAIAQGDEALAKDRARWPEAKQSFEAAIERLAALEPTDHARHLTGWALMGKANALVASDARANIEEALGVFDAAIASFGAIAERTLEREADRAALLSNKGQALARLLTPETAAASEAAFRQSIAILEAQPWQDDTRLRLLMAANYMNLGNALGRGGRPGAISEEALAALDKARQAAGEPDPAEPGGAILIATIQASIGRTLRWSSEPAQLDRALDAFQKTIAALEKLPFKQDLRLALELASAHANRSHLLGRATPTPQSVQAALRSGEIALRLAQPAESSNLLAAEVSLNARRSICHAFSLVIGSQEARVRQELHDKASDLIDDGMKLAKLWESRQAVGLRHLAQHLFHLGCAFYCREQPQFLAEFVEENLNLSEPDPVMRDSAAKIVAESIERIRKSDTPEEDAKPVVDGLQALLAKLAA